MKLDECAGNITLAMGLQRCDACRLQVLASVYLAEVLNDPPKPTEFPATITEEVMLTDSSKKTSVHISLEYGGG